MTAPNQTTPPPQTATATREKSKSDFELLLEKDVKTAVWFEPYGSNDEIKLSVPLIRRYIAVPAKDKESGQEIQPSDEECVKFLMLCKARRLNPFEGDAFMIPFWDGRLRRHGWSLITAHSAFLKRAELHPKYDGMDSGVIVQDKDGEVIYRPGDFRLNSDTLLGGWATVFHKDKAHPKVSRVKLTTYIKDFGVWLKDPEGMICKVAEAQGLRDSFPTMIGGMFLREEMGGNDDMPAIPEVKRPTFDGPTPLGLPEPTPEAPTEKPKRPRKTLVEEPLDPKPVEQPPTPQPSVQPTSAPIPAPTVPTTSADHALLALCKADGITLEQFISWLHKEGWMKKEQTKITEMSDVKLRALLRTWATLEIHKEKSK